MLIGKLSIDWKTSSVVNPTIATIPQWGCNLDELQGPQCDVTRMMVRNKGIIHKLPYFSFVQVSDSGNHYKSPRCNGIYNQQDDESLLRNQGFTPRHCHSNHW